MVFFLEADRIISKKRQKIPVCDIIPWVGSKIYMYNLQTFYSIYTKTVYFTNSRLLIINSFYKNPMFFEGDFGLLNSFEPLSVLVLLRFYRNGFYNKSVL